MPRMPAGIPVVAFLAASLGCGPVNSTGGPTASCEGVACSGHGTCYVVGTEARCSCEASYAPSVGLTCVERPLGSPPMIAGCQILPSNHIFNTPIDNLEVHPNSDVFMDTIGSHNIHLDFGSQTDMSQDDYYGIPYNIVDTPTWKQVLPLGYGDESDCADASHGLVSPCNIEQPFYPIPQNPLVEGGVASNTDGDHHILILDSSSCRLWELYNCYKSSTTGWEIEGGGSMFDLGSNDLRPDGWTSADAAGFPVLPLLLRADEAERGQIKHALRFTISTGNIRGEYIWPARHKANSSTDANKPPYGQLFRLKATYAIPASFGKQSQAILQAMKTYGMYLADGGSAMYVQGEPSALWDMERILDEVQSVNSNDFEAVDVSEIKGRTGFDPNSAAVPAL